jgi:hypothetical protein
MNPESEPSGDPHGECAAEIQRLQEALRAAQAGWRAFPEFIPEDGTRCLVWSSYHDDICIDTWQEQHEAPVSFSTITVPVGLGWDDHSEDEVLYWMPLPASPASLGQCPPHPHESLAIRTNHGCDYGERCAYPRCLAEGCDKACAPVQPVPKAEAESDHTAADCDFLRGVTNMVCEQHCAPTARAGRCACGGDLPSIQAACSNWRGPAPADGVGGTDA